MMNQLELFDQHRKAMRGFWGAEAQRVTQESVATSARQDETRATEERVAIITNEANQLRLKAEPMLNTANTKLEGQGLLSSFGNLKATIPNKESADPLADLKSSIQTATKTLSSIELTLTQLHNWQVAEQARLRRLREKEEEEEEARREYNRWHPREIISKWESKVLQCPKCSTLNRRGLDNCRRCSTSLSSVPVVKNPYY